MPSTDQILVADIGGTNARFAIAQRVDDTYSLSEIRRYEVAKHNSAIDVAKEYLQLSSFSPGCACFAVAGPIIDGEVTFTNSKWHLNAENVRKTLKLERFELVNDFVALAEGIKFLTDQDFLEIKAGIVEKGKPTLIIGPGTGLGQAIILGSEVIATEGGHVRFAPVGERQKKLVAALEVSNPDIMVERLLSGNGLVEIYRSLSSSPLHSGEAITLAAEEGHDQAAMDSLNLFFEILGQVVGDAVLSTGARGGVILAGGILPNITKLLLASKFTDRFCGKGTMRSYMEPIPIRLIIRDHAALFGAADRLDRQARSPALRGQI
ncbi:glucokinase [Hyphococcus sp. DH-69]|uniref:glucokinase n=1 Tax=Hyphococcus formosus TaxID=3143534 RepID=UPI00398AEE23